MIESTRSALSKQLLSEPPLVICSATSSEKKLHQNYFPCEYPYEKLQTILDRMIAEITYGADIAPLSRELSSLLPNKQILLGCTEFSYLHKKHPITAETLDPNTIVAEELADAYFSASNTA